MAYLWPGTYAGSSHRRHRDRHGVLLAGTDRSDSVDKLSSGSSSAKVDLKAAVSLVA